MLKVTIRFLNINFYYYSKLDIVPQHQLIIEYTFKSVTLTLIKHKMQSN